MAAGMADELLTTLRLATPATVALAPAMNQQMYRNAATQANLQTLAERGIQLGGRIPAARPAAMWARPGCWIPGTGGTLLPAARRRTAPGRRQAAAHPARPTREALDPVRYISNHSSGKMGYAIAHRPREAGRGGDPHERPGGTGHPAGVTHR